MNFHRNRHDDTFHVVLVMAAAALSLGLAVSTSVGYVLDRGSLQARADELHEEARVAEAAARSRDAANRAGVTLAATDSR